MEFMPHARYRTISQFAGAILDMKEMHLLHVVVLQRVSFKIQKSFLIFYQRDDICIYVCFVLALAPTEVIDPCNPTPCGENAICTDRQRAAACQCIPEYFGDPYVACRPECTINADCPSTKACQNLHCVDPCPGVCGINAECRVINHIPSCTCIPGYRGDPFTACSSIPSSKHFVVFLL